MGDVGQGTSSCPPCCPSLPYTAAAPLPTQSPCTQSVYDATQKAPVHCCVPLLQQELNFATFSSCLPLPSAPLISVAHSKLLPKQDPSAPPICSVLFSPFSSASDSVKPRSFSSSTVHLTETGSSFLFSCISSPATKSFMDTVNCTAPFLLYSIVGRMHHPDAVGSSDPCRP